MPAPPAPSYARGNHPSGFLSMSDVVKGFVYGMHIASAGLIVYGSITTGNTAPMTFAVGEARLVEALW